MPPRATAGWALFGRARDDVGPSVIAAQLVETKAEEPGLCSHHAIQLGLVVRQGHSRLPYSPRAAAMKQSPTWGDPRIDEVRWLRASSA